MKILYLFTSPSLRGSSVQTKVLSQIKYLNKAGAECRGAFFSTEVTEITKLNEYADLIPVEKCTWKYFRKIGQRRILDKSIYDFVKQNFTKTDLFYLRYPGASKGLFKTVKSFGSKIVSEHQSKEIDEIKSFKSENPFGIKPSFFLSWLTYQFLPIFNEEIWGRKYLKQIRMLVSVTSEMERYYKFRGCKNTFVLGNGISVNDYPVRESNIFDGKNLNLFILVGANTSGPSHGIDRLINSVKNNNSTFKIRLVIFSKNNYENAKGNTFEIVSNGFIPKEDLNNALKSFHFGIGTLASHRKKQFYGSALKVREYFSRGFPIIMASIDDDIESNVEAQKFVIQVPNNETNINFSELESEIYKIMKEEELPQKIRLQAEKIFDWGNKMLKLKEELLKLK